MASGGDNEIYSLNMSHPTHSNQMKIVSIAFVVLIAVLFFLSQKPQQSPRAMHPTNLCVAGASCEKPSECGILANHPGPDTLLGECRAGMCACNGSGGGGGSTTDVTVSCPTGTTVSGTPSCGSNSCTITCSSGSGGGGGTGGGQNCSCNTIVSNRPGSAGFCDGWKDQVSCNKNAKLCSWQCAGGGPMPIPVGGGGTCCEQISIPGQPSRCLPGQVNVCKCLSFNTRISTPSGEVTVQDVKVGDLVYSQDSSGNRVIVPVKRVSKVNVENHHVVHLVLKDRRESWVSASHPLTFIYSSSAVEKSHSTGALFMGDLKAGDIYDGSVIVSSNLIPYEYNHTYDILPDSDTGYYFANGILMGSTLK